MRALLEICAAVMETVKVPLAPLTERLEAGGGDVKGAAARSTLASGVVPVCAYRDCRARLMPVSVSRRALFPLAAELICARFTLSAIAGSPGEERTRKQTAILEGKPGIGDGSIGKA